MEKSSKPNNTESAKAIIDSSARGAAQKLAALLDQVFPSLWITPRPFTIDDQADYYGAGRVKPDFVQRDDEDWTGPALD